MCNHEERIKKATGTSKRSTTTPEVAALPRMVGGLDEDSSLWTFRVIFLGLISFFFLLILNKYFVKETSECIMSMASTVVVLYPLGYIMGLLIPQRMVYYPTFGLEFSTNQGPFALKEFAMISILANMGATIGGFTSYFVDGIMY
ncbi:hypothetical protein ACS0TY_025540 [Phlomoides rotata]